MVKTPKKEEPALVAGDMPIQPGVATLKDLQTIRALETSWIILFAVGMMSLVNYLTLIYPQIGVAIVFVAVLLLTIAKHYRKKKNLPEA